MAELFTKNLDLLGVNATFHLVRLVVLLVILYMQWRQWREGRKPGYLVAVIAFVSLAFTEMFITYFYLSGALLHLDRPVSRHPLWGDFLQSLSLALFAFSTPYLALRASQKVRWKSPALWSALFLLLVLLNFSKLEFASLIPEKIPHYENALLSLFAVGFLSWALIAVSRLQHGRRGQILFSLAFLIMSQLFHFGYFIGLALGWIPIHFGERVFSTFGYIVYLGFLHDHILAEKRELLNELRHSNAELRRLDVLKNSFLSLVSHELRTPLTAMHMAAVLLRNRVLAKNEQQKLVEVILRRSKAMAAQVEELLDVSRIQLGKLEYHKEVVEVNALLRNTLEEMHLVCNEKDISLELKTTGHDLLISGDWDRLSQVLHNLLGNSIKFTPAGGRIIVRCREDDNSVSINIEDTGVGIAPERLPHIFDLFYHMDDTNRRNGGGAGLGLFIARSIVEAHNGSITVESKLGKGTIFIVRLNRIDDAAVLTPGAGEPAGAAESLFQNVHTEGSDLA